MARMATPQQIAAIRKLTHNANQIIDRAVEGQKEHLKYNVKAMTGAERFSGKTKGLSYNDAAKKLKDLNQFYEAKGVTRKGWNEIVDTAVERANTTLKKQNFNLTNAELKEALKQLQDMRRKDKNRYVGMNATQKKQQQRKEFYLTVNKVQIAKNASPDWKGDAAAIGDALAQQLSDQQIVQTVITTQNV